MSSPGKVTILGAGIGGLTTAYLLLKKGIPVHIVEREPQVGGLMRSIQYKDFIVDFGFKNLDDGIPEVHRSWQEILAKDYAPLELRTGILYQGTILEKDKSDIEP